MLVRPETESWLCLHHLFVKVLAKVSLVAMLWDVQHFLLPRRQERIKIVYPKARLPALKSQLCLFLALGT